MATGIFVCDQWQSRHERPVYSLGETCRRCGGPTRQSGPAPYNPRDPYGHFRRALKRRRRE